ncbi:MAG: hypothetical protein AAGC67_06820 [Myxococcota bacterium]
MRPIEAMQVERAREVLERVGPDWLRRPGVTGIDVGLREREGELQDEIAIRVYVESKRALRELPGSDAFPIEENGVPVDVLVVPPADPPAD